MGQPLSVAAIRLPEAAATELLATQIAGSLPADLRGWMILLQGELGAGKSTFARAMLRAMGYGGAVPSPTYTLVEPYSLAETTVYHIDLYRVSSAAELEFLGWSDMHDGLMLIEWPERVPDLARDADAIVKLRYADTGRAAEVSAMSDRARQILIPAFQSHGLG